MVRVDQDESVPGFSPLESGNSLVHILHVVLLDPRLDALLGSELEHLPNIGWRTDVAARNLDVT